MKDIIFEHKPARYDSGSIQTIALYILPAFFILIAFKAYILATLTLVVGPFIIHFLKKLDPPTFDGWVIEFDKIVLLKNIKSGIEKKEIAYLDINKLTYFSGARRAEPKLTFYLKNGEKIWLLINYSSFDLATTFKHIQTKGIKINLIRSDAELQLFLDGRVDKIPISNKY